MLNRSGNHITTEFIRDIMWLILLFHLNCFNKSYCVHHYYVQVDLCLTKNLLVRPYQKLSKQTLFQWKGDGRAGGGRVLKGSRQVLWLAMVNDRSPNSQ